MNRWQIGKVRVSQIVEIGPVPTTPKFFFKDPPDDLVARHAWLEPHLADGDDHLLMSIHCFVVESAGRRIVVDTCVGNDKRRRMAAWNQLSGPFLSDLTAAGFAPETIDTVLCTHLHVDHVGWNTRWVDGRWVPTFPDAHYLFARREWEHWFGLAESRPAAGDAEPERVVHFDTDGELARTTRLRFLACCAGDRTLVLGTHFAHPSAGRVVSAGDVWRFEVL